MSLTIDTANIRVFPSTGVVSFDLEDGSKTSEVFFSDLYKLKEVMTPVGWMRVENAVGRAGVLIPLGPDSHPPVSFNISMTTRSVAFRRSGKQTYNIAFEDLWKQQDNMNKRDWGLLGREMLSLGLGIRRGGVYDAGFKASTDITAEQRLPNVGAGKYSSGGYFPVSETTPDSGLAAILSTIRRSSDVRESAGVWLTKVTQEITAILREEDRREES